MKGGKGEGGWPEGESPGGVHRWWAGRNFEGSVTVTPHSRQAVNVTTRTWNHCRFRYCLPASASPSPSTLTHNTHSPLLLLPSPLPA